MVPPVHTLSARDRLSSPLASMARTFVTITSPFATRPHLFELGTGPVIGRYKRIQKLPPDNCKIQIGFEPKSASIRMNEHGYCALEHQAFSCLRDCDVAVLADCG